MGEFKFIYREEELRYANDALSLNNFVILHCFDNSGLTHYLKKLQIDLCENNNVCLYLDCESNDEVSIQFSKQIISNCNQSDIKKYLRRKKKNEVSQKIIKSFVTAVDVIPFVNIGDIVINLIDSIMDTVDVDMEHITDYKIEKAIIKMLDKFHNEKTHKYIYLLIDNSQNLSTQSLDFIAKIMSYNFIKILFTIPTKSNQRGIESLSKLSSYNFQPYTLNNIFNRPDNRLIRGLFQCYKKVYKEEYVNLFERHERNIHIIMSYINGFNMNFETLDNRSLCILKILLILDTSLHLETLKQIFEKVNLFVNPLNTEIFIIIINELKKLSLVNVDASKFIHLNKKLVTKSEIEVSLIETITITRDIIEIFETKRDTLSIQQLKFVVHNLDKDYSRRKSFILELISKQKRLGKVEQQYLDMLFYLDTKKDLLEICSIYYNMHVYDVPLIRLTQHPNLIEDRECQIFLTLLKERLHEGNYCESLNKLINNSKNYNEQCLLIAIYFTALFNEGKYVEARRILQDEEFKFYYKRYYDSKYYSFLLRNISYYIEDLKVATYNYKYCLSKFKNCDPVNYNRTISNFIGYLMKCDTNPYAKKILDSIIPEVEKILEFNDPKYLYLNINYGIYLMRTDKGDPTKYFDSIVFESGTTETPYIYSQINYALYIAKTDSIAAIAILDEIYQKYIKRAKVVPTKTFYQINRILVEYMNGINNLELLNDIKNNPLRGDNKYTEELYEIYSYKFSHNIEYTNKDWIKLFLPGYIFYHGFNVELLLPSLDKPVSTI